MPARRFHRVSADQRAGGIRELIIHPAAFLSRSSLLDQASSARRQQATGAPGMPGGLRAAYARRTSSLQGRHYLAVGFDGAVNVFLGVDGGRVVFLAPFQHAAFQQTGIQPAQHGVVSR